MVSGTDYLSYVWWYLEQSIQLSLLVVYGTVYHSYVWLYLGQYITATFDWIWDSLSQLLLTGYGIISQLRLMVAERVYHSYFHGILEGITDTFDGCWDSLLQLRLMVYRPVYHSYVWFYLWQSITGRFDGIWDSIKATFDGSWETFTAMFEGIRDRLSELRLIVCETVYYGYVFCYLGQSLSGTLIVSATDYQSYVSWYLRKNNGYVWWYLG
jgi:hypothetical protein